MKTEFGSYLRYLRYKKGLTVREVSSIVNISPSHLSNLENGKRNPPNDDILLNLSSGLDLSHSEQTQLFDLAANENDRKNAIPNDVEKYIKNNSASIDVIRLGEELKYSNLNWQKVIEYMKDKS